MRGAGFFVQGEQCRSHQFHSKGGNQRSSAESSQDRNKFGPGLCAKGYQRAHGQRDSAQGTEGRGPDEKFPGRIIHDNFPVCFVDDKAIFTKGGESKGRAIADLALTLFAVLFFRLDHFLEDVRLCSNPRYFIPPIDILTRRFNWRPSAVSLLPTGTTGPYHTVTSRFSAIALIFASPAEKISFCIK